MPDYFVEMTGNDANDGKTLATAWKSVTWAVSAAAPDSIINIGKGTFLESFEIKKNLLLRGAGQTQTTIQCPESLQEVQGPTPNNPPPVMNPANFGITQMIPVIGAVKVRFEKLRISGFQTLIKDFANGIFAFDPGAHLEFESCEVTGFRHCHILILDGELVISASKIGFDKFKLHSDLGVAIGNQSKATITDSELGVWIDHCVDVYHNASVEVIHCTFRGSNTKNANGVRMSEMSTGRIAHCTFIGKNDKDVPVGWTQSAIQVSEEARADIHDNHMSGFATGLLVAGRGARVWANTITDNYNYAVQLILDSEDKEHPDLGGGYQGSPGENVIKGNGSLTGYDVRLAAKGTIYARFNEWDTKDVLSRVEFLETSVNLGAPKPVFDFLPFKQIPPPEPLDSMLLLDQSGSMLEEGKWDAAKSAVNVFSTALAKINCNNSDLKLGLMTFAETETESTHLWKPLAALPPNPAHFADVLTGPELHWGTPLGKGLLEAKKQLEPLTDGRRKYIFLLSDGKSNTGTPPILVYPGFNQLVNVYSVGFGDDSIDPETLSEISDGTLGDYYLTGSTNNLDLKRFYLYSLATPLGISIVINTREEGVTTFPINEGESKMLVMIGWEAAALEVDFDLRDPKGTLITPQNLPTGCTYQTEADASFASYTVENPVAGAWQLLNVRRKDNGPQPEVVRFVALDPNVVAQFGVDRAPGLMGNKLRLYARLMENGAGLEAGVKVKITSPEKSIGTLVATHMASKRYHVDAITRGLPAGRPLQRSDILKDYKQQHQLRVLPTVEGTAELKHVRHLSETEKNTGYFQTDFTPTEEGTYTFEFEAEGVTSSNQPFRRTYTLSKYVSFMADPEKTYVVMTAADDPSLIRQGLSRYRITVTPVSANDNLLGPFNASKISFSRNGQPLSFEIRDLMNGSYEADLLLKKEEDPREIRLRIGDREFPQSLLTPRTGCLALLARLFG